MNKKKYQMKGLKANVKRLRQDNQEIESRAIIEVEETLKEMKQQLKELIDKVSRPSQELPSLEEVQQ